MVTNQQSYRFLRTEEKSATPAWNPDFIRNLRTREITIRMSGVANAGADGTLMHALGNSKKIQFRDSWDDLHVEFVVFRWTSNILQIRSVSQSGKRTRQWMSGTSRGASEGSVATRIRRNCYSTNLSKRSLVSENLEWMLFLIDGTSNPCKCMFHHQQKVYLEVDICADSIPVDFYPINDEVPSAFSKWTACKHTQESFNFNDTLTLRSYIELFLFFF